MSGEKNMNRLKAGFADFKSFAMKGNVLDLAVGVVIGGAFGKIVSSLVNDIIMPLIGLLAGNVNLASLSIVLKPADATANTMALMLKYGAFMQSILDFLIIALSIYFVIRLIGKLKRKQDAAPAAAVATKSEELLMEIRDILKEKNQ
jgi:large conductance mechanosensitive channel